MSDESSETLRQAMLLLLDAQEQHGFKLDKLADDMRTSQRDQATVVGENTAAVRGLAKTIEDERGANEQAIAGFRNELDRLKAKGA